MMNVAAETRHDGDLSVILIFCYQQAKVFGAGYPSVPTMTQEEFLEKEILEGKVVLDFEEYVSLVFKVYNAKETLNCQNFPFSFSLTATLYVCPSICTM